MNSTTVMDMRQFVQAKNGQAFTTTQRVAEAFNKQHHHVVQKVEALDCSEQFLTSNFSRVTFEHRGNTYDAFEMTKDGFIFLVMGFTGKKAASIKEGYIAAFNWMAEQLGIGSNRMVESVLSTTIGTFGFNCLAAVLDGKVRHLPAKLRVGAKNHVWSQVRKAFSVSAVEEIPGSAMDSVRTFIAAYALEGEWLPRSEKAAAFADLIGRQLGASERWLVYTDGKGAEHYQQVPISAGVMTQQGFIEGLCRGDLPMKTAEMFDVLMSTLMHLKLRTEHQQRQLQLVP
ncbi:Rha family transcriptional regulator [Metapseudomonas otitidis]|uniref:Rha family transcriptional regulator n=1 Tax=Metapseudomonas otitidis TaxID=319939 RepID=UPI00197EE4DF|nr:Rha family transcriptional regulator [Pseudomonas otitidis]